MRRRAIPLLTLRATDTIRYPLYNADESRASTRQKACVRFDDTKAPIDVLRQMGVLAFSMVYGNGAQTFSRKSFISHTYIEIAVSPLFATLS
jgi:hypothetical protein